MVFLKNRYLAFWSKVCSSFPPEYGHDIDCFEQYNYILSASWSSAIAIAAIIIFFGLQWSEIELNWWGNNVVSMGCEGKACTRFVLEEGGYFGPGIGEFK